LVSTSDIYLLGKKLRYYMYGRPQYSRYEKDTGPIRIRCGLATLVAQIKYKCDWYGKTFHQVSRFYPSSKTCSVCGEKSSFGMDVREWMCFYCWSFHVRDLNAAINILRQGIAELYKITPAELAGEGHGEDVRLEVGISPLIATSMKCQMSHICVT
jgi:hypothetical protein